MFCKSGILIFIFAENNYSIYAHTMLIKTPLLHQSSCPHVFLSLSFSLSLRLFLWSTEALWVHFPAWASKTLLRRHSVPSPHREGARGLHEQSKPHARGFIGFLRKPRTISLFLSIFFLVNSGPPGSGPLKDLNIGSLKTQGLGKRYQVPAPLPLLFLRRLLL